jgi:hypothetical protein
VERKRATRTGGDAALCVTSMDRTAVSEVQSATTASGVPATLGRRDRTKKQADCRLNTCCTVCRASPGRHETVQGRTRVDG